MAKITNEMKYKTAEERVKAFESQHCERYSDCAQCQYNSSCGGIDGRSIGLYIMAHWLLLEAVDYEWPMPCPFCGGECEIDGVCTNEDQSSKYVSCTNDRCMYQSPIGKDESAAIAAHNRVCRAVKDFPVLEKMKIELLNIAHNGSKTTVAEIVEKYLTVKGEDSNKE